jgi:putative endonuclease
MRWPGSKTSESGLWGEAQAERFLRSLGYKILGRRVHVGRHDEIDLLARDDESLVFIEVKTRKDEVFGRPAGAIDKRKHRALSRAALRYMKGLRVMPPYFRFDVVEVVGEPEDTIPEIRHIKHAFTLDSRYTLVY